MRVRLHNASPWGHDQKAGLCRLFDSAVFPALPEKLHICPQVGAVFILQGPISWEGWARTFIKKRGSFELDVLSDIDILTFDIS